MAGPGRIRRRLALAIVLTALIPVLVAVLLAERMVQTSSARFFRPEIGARLDQSLGLYQELARSVKARMRAEATAIAAREPLRAAVRARDVPAIERELRSEFSEYRDLVSLTVDDANGEHLARADRGRPLDPKKENALEVSRPLGEASDADDAPDLVALFAASKARFDELNDMSQFVETYKQIEKHRRADENAYVYAFAALLGITILAAVGVGALLARGVSARIAELAAATQRVGAGDLSTRVPEKGGDEITDLAFAFNRMLGEVETSRARIEYLQRIGAWQEMARRLAHEIKNPLTPIQLAVQEIHRRYPGSDPAYQKLIDTTLEIVEDEVGTLRRLVSEFSGFARMPQANLQRADLGEFLREQRARMSLSDEGELEGHPLPESGEGSEVGLLGVDLELDVPEGVAEVYMDRQMLRRALINLVRNAAEAIHEAGKQGKVRISLKRDGDFWVIDIDDDGPGIPDEMHHTIFDPYVTTKADGTGLGLAIVKKVVVEHGGSIVAAVSPQGGARMRIRLPAAESAAGAAAREAGQWQAPPSSGRSSRGAPAGT
jgi:nitrogen fixation/metabolism regulation signal transduction histidine kinase